MKRHNAPSRPPKTVSYVTHFKRDLRRAQRRGWDLEKLWRMVRALSNAERLPPNARVHKLGGKERDLWELHIEPDWLLIYENCEERLILRRTGTHSDLF